MHISKSSLAYRFAALTICVALGCVKPAGAQSLQGLGFLPNSPPLEKYSIAAAVSADGSIVFGGSSVLPNRVEPVIWSRAGGTRGLGFPANYENVSINDTSADGSIVVGQANQVSQFPITQEAVVWSRATGWVGLGFLDHFENDWSVGNGISADGSTIVGASSGEAFIWTADTGMVGLGKLPGPEWNNTEATSVSADGSTIVGIVHFEGGDKEPFIWTAATGMVVLGVLPGGARSFFTRASDVSADGSTVVGTAFLADGFNQAFIWKAAMGMRRLGSLHGVPYEDSYATGISADGRTVVGMSGGEAFVWTATNGMVGLGFMPGATSGGSYAAAISNDASTVVGSATNADGFQEAFRLRLRPAIHVAIDVLPDSRDNQINLKSRGKVPVAILSNRTFDALRVDPSTVSFGDPRLTKVPPIKSSKQDVDCDGDKDLVLQFDTETLVAAGAIDANSTKVVLVGRTFAGEPIQGSDRVTVKSPKPGR